MGTQSTWGQKKLKKMMKLLCLLLALTSLVITAPSCKTSAMCQACDATTADKCTKCYNKGNDTTFNARALATNACANVITTGKIDTCKVYSDASDGLVVTTQECVLCTTASDWMNITFASGVTTAVTCSATSIDPVSTTACSANPIASCTQQVCHSDGGTPTLQPLCAMRNTGKAGVIASTGILAGLGSKACEVTNIIPNCAFHVAPAPIDTTNHCYSCLTGYAVASPLIACTAYTTDTNCRVLLADGACGECVTGYYWNGAICGLTALVSVLSTMSLAILALLN